MNLIHMLHSSVGFNVLPTLVMQMKHLPGPMRAADTNHTE